MQDSIPASLVDLAHVGSDLQMAVNWQAIWRRLTTTKYTAMLEDEVDRLREENRGMMNSLLTRAGVQPIDVQPPTARAGRRMSRYQRQMEIERDFYQKAAKDAEKDDRGAAH